MVSEFMPVFKECNEATYPAPKLTMLDSGGLAQIALCAPTSTTVEVEDSTHIALLRLLN